MCGILAVFAKAVESVGVNNIIEASSLIRHRGPDDEGYLVCDPDGRVELFGGVDSPDYGNLPLDYLPKSNTPAKDKGHDVLMAHRRLSIIDLSLAGHQPMSYGEGRYWIIYNGEIYNYIEVREELLALGCQFRSKSDTEVILAAYSTWGEDCVRKFNGMWAFVIVDIKEKKAFISRDRFGVKPLYYWRSERGFIALSSEIKAFTRLPGWNPLLNCQRAYDFLVWDLMDHSDETLFKGVLQVPPGHNMTLLIDDLGLKKEAYFDISDDEGVTQLEGSAERFRSLFTDSVRLRMRSDVQVGSCLSGGLDSSSIVATADALVKEKDPSEGIVVFTSCSDRPEFDECKYADELINSRHLSSFKVTPNAAGLLADLENIVWHQDEPFRTTSIFAQWCVFRKAAQSGIKVMLDGQGADEYLAGYEGFIYPRLIRLVRERDLGKLLEELKGLKANQGISMGDILAKTMRGMLNVQNRASSLIDPARFDIDTKYPVGEGMVRTSDLRRFSYGQLKYTSLPRLLHWEDRNSMAWSVESRVPFLDYRLVQFVVGLPDDAKIRNGIQKVILRDAMRGVLPVKIVDRTDKMGFITPEKYWLTEEVDVMSQIVDQATASVKEFLVKGAPERIQGMMRGTIEYEPWVWRFIIFGLWMKRFAVEIDEPPSAWSI